MTPKQEKILRNRIAQIRKKLAADKKHWGGFHHDGGGMRYKPPELFIKLTDYKGGLSYLKWFDKTFPDDSGYPIFLFEWTIILFKTGRTHEAERKAFQTFFSNTYLFDKFLEKEFLQLDKWEGSNWEQSSLTEHFNYSKNDSNLIDFVIWLESFLTSQKFYGIASEFIEIEKRLKDEPVGRTRSELVERCFKLLKA